MCLRTVLLAPWVVCEHECIDVCVCVCVGGPAGKQTWSFWEREIRRCFTREYVGLSAGSKKAAPLYSGLQKNSQEKLFTH